MDQGSGRYFHELLDSDRLAAVSLRVARFLVSCPTRVIPDDGSYWVRVPCRPARSHPVKVTTPHRAHYSLQGVYTVCMARLNVYVPDDMAKEAKAAKINVSAITQHGLARALATRNFTQWVDSLDQLDPVHLAKSDVEAALDDARSEFGA